MTSAELKRLVESDPDFIAIRKFGYDINTMLKKYPDGAPSSVIAEALLIDESEVEELYSSIIQKIRKQMRV